MKNLDNKLITLYLLSAVAFVVSLFWHPYSGSFVLKAIPALSMAALLFLDDRKYYKFMGIGFIFSALGDIALDLDRVKYFVFGLAFFLIAHLFYSFTFFKVARKKIISPLKISLVVLFAVGMGILLWPKLGALKIPVMVYLGVIALMTISTSLFESKNHMAYFGAWIFMSSDAMIAINKFLEPFPHARFAIIVTYYVGNFMLGISLIRKNQV
jgi:alkenylglycerophosphocholine/alkenylglycerophosphoethanolamine hydrolase